MNDYDLVVIGAGNAGLAAARTVRKAGRSVLVVEARDVGGTCPLRGCVPKKVLVAAAEALDVIARAADQGIATGPVSTDWARIIDRKEEILAGTSEALESDLARNGIDLARERARFAGPNLVAAGDRRVRARDPCPARSRSPARSAS
jgi:glutathione reductase (NADPH)